MKHACYASVRLLPTTTCLFGRTAPGNTVLASVPYVPEVRVNNPKCVFAFVIYVFLHKNKSMTKNFDIASKAEKGRKKDRGERNGDCCSWIEENGCVVLALADGVGHCANDYEAAQTTCSQFIEKCRKALQNGDRLDESKLRRFCEEIDPVLARKNEMACFCAIVWIPEENESVWFHVGDTRIYRYSYREGMCQLTEDDHGTPVAVKMNGKVHTDHGSVVTATPISSAIGDMKREFHTGRCDFLNDRLGVYRLAHSKFLDHMNLNSLGRRLAARSPAHGRRRGGLDGRGAV